MQVPDGDIRHLTIFNDKRDVNMHAMNEISLHMRNFTVNFRSDLNRISKYAFGDILWYEPYSIQMKLRLLLH